MIGRAVRVERILRALATFLPPSRRDWGLAMIAELRAVPPGVERGRFAFGCGIGLLRFCARSWAGDPVLWALSFVAGAAVPIIDTHGARPCLLVPMAVVISASAAWLSPWASWRWPLAVLCGVGLSGIAGQSPAFLDAVDLRSLVPLTIGAAWAAALSTRARALAAFSLVVLVTPLSGQSAPREAQGSLAAAIDSMVRAEMARTAAPGVAITVRKGGIPVISRGYGVANRSTGQPMSADTPLPIGSITKSFTAAAVVRELATGRLELDAPIAGFFPGRRLDDRITTRHLLNHTSGLKAYEQLIPAVGSFARTAVAPDTILSFISGAPVDHAPGTRWLYSNTGYHLLGLILESVSGARYFDRIRDLVADSIGFRLTGSCPERTVYQGYEREASGITPTVLPHANFSFAAGGLCSTTSELAHWIESIPRVVGDTWFDRMAAPAPLPANKAHPYGFGIALGELGDRPWIGHGGSLPGFDAFVAHYRRDSTTIAIIANIRPFDSEGLQKRIARRVLGIADVAVLDLPVSAAEQQQYAGTYTLSGRSLRIVLEDGRLKLVGPGDFTLLRQASRVFVAREDTDLRVEFVFDGDRVTGMIFTSPGRRFELQRAQ